MRVGGLDLTRLLYYEAKNVTVKNMVLNSYQSFIKKVNAIYDSWGRDDISLYVFVIKKESDNHADNFGG